MKTSVKSVLFFFLAALLAVFGASPAAAQAGRSASPQQSAAWTQAAGLTAADGAAADALGSSIAMSADGLTVVSGAPDKTISGKGYQGAVYVFTRPAGGWANAASAIRLTASDGAAADYFGSSVAISGDGSTIVVGAGNKQAGNVTGPGEVYVFVKPANGWASGAETARLTPLDGANGDRFGASVAASTNASTIVVGASGKQVGNNTYQGQVYVFVKPAQGGWASGHETARLTVSGGASHDFLGKAVSVSGDGAILVAGADGRVVGAHGGSGAVFLFEKPGSGGWANGNQKAMLSSSDGQDSDFMGSAVAISADGTTVVAGAPNKFFGSAFFEGEAYIFVKPTSGGWVTTASEKARLSETNSRAYEQLGQAVAVNSDGSTVVVGAPRPETDNSAFIRGSVNAYVRPAGGWATTTETAKLTVSGTASADRLGGSVATNGSTTVSGAYGKQVGSNAGQGEVYVFVGGLAATVTTLTSSPNFSWLGSAVKFTAVVKPASGSGTPTGSVTFTIDGIAQPPAALVSGSAAISISSLSGGAHTITAAYSGDASFAASASAPLVQRVAKYKYLCPLTLKSS